MTIPRKTTIITAASLQPSAMSLKVKAGQTLAEKRRRDFLFQCGLHDVPLPQTEVRFMAERKWMLDFAWAAQMVCLESHGGTKSYGKSGHNSAAGTARDRDKANAAQLRGWLYLQVASDELCTVDTITLVKRALRVRSLTP